MLKKMKQNDFISLDNSELVFACFDHLIPLIRAKNNRVKEEVYTQLGEGQKALFMFNAYFNHANKSLMEFYWWSAYYYAQPKGWSAILRGLQFFQTNQFMDIFSDLEEMFVVMDFPRSLEAFKVTYNDLNQDPELLEAFQLLHNKFMEVSPETLEMIGDYIRNNPALFIEFED